MSTFESIKALTFDHYGTLFDKHAVAKVIEQDFPGHGEELARLWFSTIKKYCWLSGLMERYLTWDDITGRALTFAGKSLSLDVTAHLHQKLIEADLILPPYPEVPAALARLAAKRDLYVLTMASAWMVEASQKNSGVDKYFKKVISAEPHGAYKPATAAYDLGVREIGLPREQIGFISSNSFDVMGGAHYGFPTFWLNRTGVPLDELGPQPDLVVKDLAELATVLGA